METATNPAIIVLTLTAAGAALTAWWVSIQRERRRGRLVDWIKANHAARWAALPWFSRRFMPDNGVERLRRQGLGNDVDFMIRYRDSKRGTWLLLGLIGLGILLIGMVPLGVRYLGWTW